MDEVIQEVVLQPFRGLSQDLATAPSYGTSMTPLSPSKLGALACGRRYHQEYVERTLIPAPFLSSVLGTWVHRCIQASLNGAPSLTGCVALTSVG